MVNPTKKVKTLTDIYIWSLLLCNNINHKEMLAGSDRRKIFTYEQSEEFDAAIKAFNEDIRFTAVVDGVELELRPRRFAKALQEVKSLIHS